MSDEDDRRELHETLLGRPSRRRLVELERFASALAACSPTETEKADSPVIFSLIADASGKISIGTIAKLREALSHYKTVFVFDPGPRGEDYGPPAWLGALQASLERRAVPTFRLRLPEVETESPARARAREKTRANVRRRPPRRLP